MVDRNDQRAQEAERRTNQCAAASPCLLPGAPSPRRASSPSALPTRPASFPRAASSCTAASSYEATKHGQVAVSSPPRHHHAMPPPPRAACSCRGGVFVGHHLASLAGPVQVACWPRWRPDWSMCVAASLYVLARTCCNCSLL